MSKPNHNYSQYSNKNHKHNNNQNKPKTPVIEPAQPVTVKETVETAPIPETVEGVVVGCAKLNVRAEANLFSDVVCVLDASSEMTIDVNKSNREWFYICTAAGIEGYCMRKYVEAHL